MIRLLKKAQIEKYNEFLSYVKEYVAPRAYEWEKNKSIPREVIELCCKQGFLGCCIPEEWGGNDWDLMIYGLFIKAVAEVSTSLSGLFNVHTMVLQTIYKWGTDAQKKSWLPRMCAGEVLGALALTEPGAGSDVQGIVTSFRKTEEGYIVNGTKRWITFGASADIYLVFGKIDGGNSSVACLIPRETPGLTVTKIDDMLGFRAGNLAVLQFNNCFVPAVNLIGREDMALQYVAPYALNFGRICVSFTALAILEGCLKESCLYARKRVTFGERLLKRSSIQEMITQMGVDLEAANMLCYQMVQENTDGSQMDRVMIAKYFTSRAACRHAANAVQILGASGCIDSSLVSRYYRDSKILEIIEGSNQIHERILTGVFARNFK